MRESTIVAEWKAETKRGDLREVLETKFVTPVPSDLATTIEGQSDIEVLSRWIRSAIRAESLEAFRAAMAPPS